MTSPLWSNIFKKNQTREERMTEAIRNVNIFRNLSPKELKEVRSMVYSRTYKSGEYIFHEGQPGNGVYIILNGTVQIQQENDRNGEKKTDILATLHSGDFLGEMSLLDESPRSASACCSELTEALGFFRGDLMDLLNRRPFTGSKIVLNISRVLAERLRVTNQQLAELQDKAEES